MKKIIFLVLIILLIASGGFFWWQGDQKDVKELNKKLPDGIKVAKSFLGDEYKVINKIDGYEFKVPKEWGGINEVEYNPERTEEGYILASIELEGKEGGSRITVINRFKIENSDINLGSWAETNFETFGLTGDFTKDNIGEFETVKTREEAHLLDMAVYFFKKDSVIYTITCDSEEFIREIIANGKW